MKYLLSSNLKVMLNFITVPPPSCVKLDKSEQNKSILQHVTTDDVCIFTVHKFQLFRSQIVNFIDPTNFSKDFQNS